MERKEFSPIVKAVGAAVISAAVLGLSLGGTAKASELDDFRNTVWKANSAVGSVNSTVHGVNNTVDTVKSTAEKIGNFFKGIFGQKELNPEEKKRLLSELKDIDRQYKIVEKEKDLYEAMKLKTRLEEIQKKAGNDKDIQNITDVLSKQVNDFIEKNQKNVSNNLPNSNDVNVTKALKVQDEEQFSGKYTQENKVLDIKAKKELLLELKKIRDEYQNAVKNNDLIKATELKLSLQEIKEKSLGDRDVNNIADTLTKQVEKFIEKSAAPVSVSESPTPNTPKVKKENRYAPTL